MKYSIPEKKKRSDVYTKEYKLGVHWYARRLIKWEFQNTLRKKLGFSERAILSHLVSNRSSCDNPGYCLKISFCPEIPSWQLSKYDCIFMSRAQYTVTFNIIVPPVYREWKVKIVNNT